MKRTHLAAATAVALAVLGALGAASIPAAPAASRTTLADIRAVTAKYANVNLARAHGYRPVGGCVSSPLGAMGIHYLNQQLLETPAIIARKPEILLYAPLPGGGRRLIGLEYMKIDADQNLRTSADKPSLFARRFDGPMLGHAPGMPKHYDLHLWLFAPNPRGLFAEYNPTLRC